MDIHRCSFDEGFVALASFGRMTSDPAAIALPTLSSSWPKARPAAAENAIHNQGCYFDEHTGRKLFHYPLHDPRSDKVVKTNS
jgi:hypothetical protein